MVPKYPGITNSIHSIIHLFILRNHFILVTVEIQIGKNWAQNDHTLYFIKTNQKDEVILKTIYKHAVNKQLARHGKVKTTEKSRIEARKLGRQCT